MDERSHIIDPNRDIYEDLNWWEELGETDRPSPYAVASWAYWHDFEKMSQDVGNAVLFHTYASMKVYDTKASHPGDDSTVVDIEERGKLLGEINYEIVGPLLTITDWSHYNWRDAQPIRMAFKVLVSEVPDCVEIITVRDEPTAFWRSLGFKHSGKGDGYLVYDKLMTIAEAY
jgi:hypothetical protein